MMRFYQKHPIKSEKTDYLCKCNRQKKINKIYMFKRKAIEDLRKWAKKQTENL